MPKVTRRSFLNATLGSLACSYAFGEPPSWARAHPLHDHMKVIGRAYLAEHPTDAHGLRVKLLASGLGPQQSARLEDVIRDDFRAGRTVAVRGWMLSSTEANLCALLAQGQSSTG